MNSQHPHHHHRFSLREWLAVHIWPGTKDAINRLSAEVESQRTVIINLREKLTTANQGHALAQDQVSFFRDQFEQAQNELREAKILNQSLHEKLEDFLSQHRFGVKLHAHIPDLPSEDVQNPPFVQTRGVQGRAAVRQQNQKFKRELLTQLGMKDPGPDAPIGAPLTQPSLAGPILPSTTVVP